MGAALVHTRTELFFGLSRPDGSPDVTGAEFETFLESEVTPRFPDGYTVVVTEGRWRGASGVTQREPARLLILVHDDTRECDERIDAIRDAYKSRFKQEAVLRIDSTARASF